MNDKKTRDLLVNQLYETVSIIKLINELTTKSMLKLIKLTLQVMEEGIKDA